MATHVFISRENINGDEDTTLTDLQVVLLKHGPMSEAGYDCVIAVQLTSGELAERINNSPHAQEGRKITNLDVESWNLPTGDDYGLQPGFLVFECNKNDLMEIA